MKRTLILFAVVFAMLGLSACTRFPAQSTGRLTNPHFPIHPDRRQRRPCHQRRLPTPVVADATPTAQPASGYSPFRPLPPRSLELRYPRRPGLILPGLPSGPYGVILVAAGDALNVRSVAGTSGSIIGTFAATANNVMRTGPSISINNTLWVQVISPSSGTGWVDSAYLTEYVAPATFCADGRVNTLLNNFGNAVKTSNGGALYPLVSPVHGMAVRLWRNGNAVVFDQAHAQWIFTSTFIHMTGARRPAAGWIQSGRSMRRWCPNGWMYSMPRRPGIP